MLIFVLKFLLLNIFYNQNKSAFKLPHRQFSFDSLLICYIINILLIKKLFECFSRDLFRTNLKIISIGEFSVCPKKLFTGYTSLLNWLSWIWAPVNFMIRVWFELQATSCRPLFYIHFKFLGSFYKIIAIETTRTVHSNVKIIYQN